MEGGVCEVRGIHPVEVVDIAAAHEEEQGASKELQCVPRSIKVPDGGRRPEAHGVVEPQGRARGGVQDGAAMGRHFDRPLAVSVQEVMALKPDRFA